MTDCKGDLRRRAHAIEAEGSNAVGGEDFAAHPGEIRGAAPGFVADDDSTLAGVATACVNELTQRLSRLANGSGVDAVRARPDRAANAAGANVDVLVKR